MGRLMLLKDFCPNRGDIALSSVSRSKASHGISLGGGVILSRDRLLQEIGFLIPCSETVLPSLGIGGLCAFAGCSSISGYLLTFVADCCFGKSGTTRIAEEIPRTLASPSSKADIILHNLSRTQGKVLVWPNALSAALRTIFQETAGKRFQGVSEEFLRRIPAIILASNAAFWKIMGRLMLLKDFCPNRGDIALSSVSRSKASHGISLGGGVILSRDRLLQEIGFLIPCSETVLPSLGIGGLCAFAGCSSISGYLLTFVADCCWSSPYALISSKQDVPYSKAHIRYVRKGFASSNFSDMDELLNTMMESKSTLDGLMSHRQRP
eukprot:Gb_04870 [translate_table: standard]